jgi:hypothetical protein
MAAQVQECPRPRTETGQESVLAEGQRGELARHADSDALGRHHPQYGQEGQEGTLERGLFPPTHRGRSWSNSWS